MVRSIMESLRQAVIPAGVSSGVGAGIVYLGHSVAPFVMTSVPHAALFGAAVTLVAKTVSPLFWKMGMGYKTNIALSYTIGAVAALAVSVAAAYVGVTASALSLAGVIALTVAAVAVSLIFARLPDMNICPCLST